MLSLILGERKALDNKTHNTFSNLGIYHLLVLSGLHISIFVFFCFNLAYLPLVSGYSLCLINCGQFFCLQDILRVLISLLLFLYGYLVGFPPSVQRSSLSAMTLLLFPLIPWSFTLKEKLLLTLFLQILIFPKNFLQNSNLLSWASVIIIVGSSLESPRTLKNLLKTQILLSLLIAAVCGKLNLIGILINLIIIPIFSFTYVLALLPLFDSILPPFIIAMAVEFQVTMLNLLHSLALISSFYPWLSIDLLMYHQSIRSLLLVLFCYFFTDLIHRLK